MQVGDDLTSRFPTVPAAFPKRNETCGHRRKTPSLKTLASGCGSAALR
jgi:hypothetical protein